MIAPLSYVVTLDNPDRIPEPGFLIDQYKTSLRLVLYCARNPDFSGNHGFFSGNQDFSVRW